MEQSISSIELSKTDYKTLTITSTTPLDAAKQYTVAGSATASVKDLAGNEQTTFTAKDTAVATPATPAGAAVKVGANNAADIINSANVASVTVDGTTANITDVGTIVVTLSDGTKTVTGSVVKTVDNNATFSVTGINATTLAEGPITVNAKLVTPGGLESAVKVGTGATKDTVAPTVVGLTGSTATSLVIEFTEELKKAGGAALDADFFAAIATFFEEDSAAQAITAATYDNASKKITLTVDGAFADTEKITLKADALYDAAGNAVATVDFVADAGEALKWK